VEGNTSFVEEQWQHLLNGNLLYVDIVQCFKNNPQQQALAATNKSYIMPHSWGIALIGDIECQFSQDIGEWPQNQILIPDWTYFHCSGATLVEPLKTGIQHLLLGEL